MIQVSLIREPSYSLIEERANKPPPKMTCTNFLDHVLFFLDLVPNGKGFSKSGRVLNKIPGRGSGLGRVGVSEFMIGYFWVSFLLSGIFGYFWVCRVFSGMLGIFGYFWVYPYILEILSNIY